MQELIQPLSQDFLYKSPESPLNCGLEVFLRGWQAAGERLTDSRQPADGEPDDAGQDQ